MFQIPPERKALERGAAIFDNECYTIGVSKAKKAIQTTIIMK